MSPSSFGGATQSGGFTFGNPASAPGFSANQPGCSSFSSYDHVDEIAHGCLSFIQ